MNRDTIRKLSFCNEHLLKASRRAGCYSCYTIFKPSKIKWWSDGGMVRTAHCPNCSFDFVVPELVNVPLDEGFLRWLDGASEDDTALNDASNQKVFESIFETRAYIRQNSRLQRSLSRKKIREAVKAVAD